ncbi:MAG TPA: NAD(P)H-dependent oxidoreductase [Membranihabitans sp.]|nr:NAD(P)H-dependent oxidoreductase [Membranihabitans sp.]
MKVKAIIASTRPGRRGPALARWIVDILQKEADLDVALIDLKEVNLPFLDESAHPRLRKYEKEYTIKWSAEIDEADAFVMVTPEYNHIAPPTLLNAINFLHQEWSEKPVGFVSYGGVSGGTRAVESLIPVATALGMMPIPKAVNVPFFATYIDAEGRFMPGEIQNKAAKNMVAHLKRWARALQAMRVEH